MGITNNEALQIDEPLPGQVIIADNILFSGAHIRTLLEAIHSVRNDLSIIIACATGDKYMARDLKIPIS